MDDYEMSLTLLDGCRDDEFLKLVINNYVKKFKGELSKKEIVDRLKSNGFNGLYILNDDDFNKLLSLRGGNPDNTCGSFFLQENIIVLNKKNASANEIIAAHELTHALINGELGFSIKDDSSSFPSSFHYGIGIEEGFCAFVEQINDGYKGNDERIAHSGYYLNIMLINQLNLLYSKYSKKKYNHIVLEAIKDPKNFMNLIYSLYDEYMSKVVEYAKGQGMDEREVRNMVLRCSYGAVCSMDYFTEKKCFDNDCNQAIVERLFGISSFINTIMIAIKDDNVKYGKINPKYLKHLPNSFFKNLTLDKGGLLLNNILGNNAYYYDFLTNYLKLLYVNIINCLEDVTLSGQKK